MKLITRDTDYALRALCYIISQKEKVVSTNELRARLKMPRPFLRKILQRLQKHKLLKSFKGKNGGFVKSGHLEKVSLWNIIQVFQGSISLSDCLFRKKHCPYSLNCVLRKRILYWERKIFSEFKKTTLEDLNFNSRDC